MAAADGTGPRAVALMLAVLTAGLFDRAGAAEDVFVRPPATLERCLEIPPDAYRTGMIFNPQGHATYYERALCFQNLAIATRDAGYCDRVRERRSLFFDGSGVAPGTCRRLVARQRQEDRRAAERIAAASIHRVVDAAVQRDGNGRDYDLKVHTEGSYSGRYWLRVIAVTRDGVAVDLLDRAQPLGSAPAELVHLLPADRLARALGTADHSARLDLTVILTLQGHSADADHVLDLVPLQRRRSRHTLSVVLDALPPWVPQRLD